MKNILRTSTVLMLVLGLGVSVPKIMDSRAIDTPTSPGNLPVELKVDAALSSDLISEKLEITKIEKEEFSDENPVFLEENTESEENFPIKTDTLQNAVEVEAKVEPSIIKEEKNNNDSNVVNSPKTENTPTPAKEVPAPVVEVKTPPVEVKAPDTAPTKEAVTEINASYDRFAKTTLNVRSGPGTSHQKISTLKTGQKVLVTKVASNGWSYIESNGIKGYVSSSYLVKTAPPVPTPPPATKPTPPCGYKSYPRSTSSRKTFYP